MVTFLYFADSEYQDQTVHKMRSTYSFGSIYFIRHDDICPVKTAAKLQVFFHFWEWTTTYHETSIAS